MCDPDCPECRAHDEADRRNDTRRAGRDPDLPGKGEDFDARQDAIMRARYAECAVIMEAEDSCPECQRWRDLRHPLQSVCDKHMREVRVCHAKHDYAERVLARDRDLHQAHEEGARAAETRLRTLAAAVRAHLNGDDYACMTPYACAHDGDPCSLCTLRAALEAAEADR